MRDNARKFSGSGTTISFAVWLAEPKPTSPVKTAEQK
jgi:hypothetical protein